MIFFPQGPTTEDPLPPTRFYLLLFPSCLNSPPSYDSPMEPITSQSPPLVIAALGTTQDSTQESLGGYFISKPQHPTSLLSLNSLKHEQVSPITFVETIYWGQGDSGLSSLIQSGDDGSLVHHPKGPNGKRRANKRENEAISNDTPLEPAVSEARSSTACSCWAHTCFVPFTPFPVSL